MSDTDTDALAEELTAQIVAIDGVRGLFPSHTIAAAVLTAVTAIPATALVDVDARGGIIRVKARLATDRDVPSSAVIAEVNRITRHLTDGRPLALDVELAHID